MPIEYGDSTAIFREMVGVDEAEDLLQWLHNKAHPRIDLSECTHIHPANLQVLMAAATMIVAWPPDPTWRQWLESALPKTRGDL